MRGERGKGKKRKGEERGKGEEEERGERGQGKRGDETKERERIEKTCEFNIGLIERERERERDTVGKVC